MSEEDFEARLDVESEFISNVAELTGILAGFSFSSLLLLANIEVPKGAGGWIYWLLFGLLMAATLLFLASIYYIYNTSGLIALSRLRRRRGRDRLLRKIESRRIRVNRLNSAAYSILFICTLLLLLLKLLAKQ